MRINKLIITFLFLPFFCQCQQESHYTKLGIEGGQAFITIHSNKTYDYLWYRYFDVGPIDDTISHSGTWSKNGDTLIFNSYKTPDNYDFVSIKEELLKTDSIKILITTNDSLPFFFIAPKQIRINDRYYELPNVNIESFVKFSLPRFQINHIVIPGYPVYKPKDKNSNSFHFSIKELSGEKFEYSGGTYFLNEKFLSKGDTLYQLWNNEATLEYIKSK